MGYLVILAVSITDISAEDAISTRTSLLVELFMTRL